MDPAHATDIEIPDDSSAYTERNCTDVRKEFQKAGFSNITLVPKYDLGIFGPKKDEIQSITIKGSNTFAKGTWVSKDTEVVITFHTEEPKFDKKNYQDVKNTLAEMGFINIDLKPLGDLSPRERNNAGKVERVLIRDKDFNSATEYNLLDRVTITYHSEQVATAAQVKVTIDSKTLIGKNYSDVVAELTAMGFNNVTSVPLGDVSWGVFAKDGAVDSISMGDASSFKEGEIFGKDVPVIVKYHSAKK